MGANFLPSPRSSASGLFGTAIVLFLAASVTAPAQPKWANKLAPYVTSPQRVVDRMLQLAEVKPTDTVYDLGCGDGRVLITAAQRYNAKAVGIEISEKLVQEASARVDNLGLQNKVKIVHGDVRAADFSPADVVVMYLFTKSNGELRPRLEKLLKPGTRVVSYSYPVPGWKPKLVDRTDEHDGHAIYLYEMPPTPAEK